MPKLKFKILNSNLTETMVKDFKIKEDQEEDQMCLTMIHWIIEIQIQKKSNQQKDSNYHKYLEVIINKMTVMMKMDFGVLEK